VKLKQRNQSRVIIASIRVRADSPLRLERPFLKVLSSCSVVRKYLEAIKLRYVESLKQEY
jgi:hypothetical protein